VEYLKEIQFIFVLTRNSGNLIYQFPRGVHMHTWTSDCFELIAKHSILSSKQRNPRKACPLNNFRVVTYIPQGTGNVSNELTKNNYWWFVITCVVGRAELTMNSCVIRP